MHPLQKLLQETGANVRSYSGRGMYGKTCLAVDGTSLKEVIGSLVDAAMEFSAAQRGEIADAMRNFSHDGMGLGIVVYWPGVPYTEDERIVVEDDELPESEDIPGQLADGSPDDEP